MRSKNKLHRNWPLCYVGQGAYVVNELALLTTRQQQSVAAGGWYLLIITNVGRIFIQDNVYDSTRPLDQYFLIVNTCLTKEQHNNSVGHTKWFT